MSHDVVFASDIVLDAGFGHGPAQQTAADAIERAIADGFRIWQYVGTASILAHDARARAKGGNNGHTGTFQVPDLIRRLQQRTQWLAALAEDGDVWSSEDPIAHQFVRAISRLGQPIVVTNHPGIRERCPHAVGPHEFMARTTPDRVIEFIDLRSQQDRIRPQLERAVFDVMRHGLYIMGPEIKTLETRLAEYVGVKHCVAVASGTDSLLIALMALGIGPGDEVITVPYTWISTAEVISLIHAKPVFVDIEPRTFNMNVDLLERAITPRTKAIMPVSLYGQCPDMDRINAIAAKYQIPVIEDAAQSFGATYNGRRSCGLSQIGSTSFFPSKPLGCYGDGGALFTDDDHLADLFRQIRVHGQKKKHHHEVIGINGRLDTLQAAILLPKIGLFDEECAARARCGAYYSELIAERQAQWGVSPEEAARRIDPPIVAHGNTSVFAQYTITSDYNDAIREHLHALGIPSVTYYAVPLHLQPAFRELQLGVGMFPVAEALAGRGLSLPMSPGLTPADQQRVVDAIFAAIDRQIGKPA